MNADVKVVHVHPHRALVFALLLALVTLLAPMVADAAWDTGLVPAAQADGPQRNGGG
jgi:hypothetical protein